MIFLSENLNYKLALKNRIGNPTIEIVNEVGYFFNYNNSVFTPYKLWNYTGSYRGIEKYPTVFDIAEKNNGKVVLHFESGDNVELHRECFKRQL